MALPSFWNGLLSLLSGGISQIFTGGSENLGKILGGFGEGLADIGANNTIGNYAAKMSGSRLTDAEREANAWTAQREDLMFNRQVELANTAHQREVADLKAAGINPMLSTGAGAVSPAPSVSGSVSPSSSGLNLGALLEFALQSKILPAKIANMNADTEEKLANADKMQSENTGVQLANEFFSNTMDIRGVLLSDEHERNSWERAVAEKDAETRASAQRQMEKQSNQYIRNLEAQEELIYEQVKNQPLQRALLKANAREANASAEYKAAMQAVDEKLGNTQEAKTREELEILKVEARLKNGIYNDTTIRNLCKAANAEASIKVVTAAYQRGDYSYASKELVKMFHELEKNGELPVESWTIGTATHSTNGAASASALPY